MKRVSAPVKAALAAVNVIQESPRTEKRPRRVISPRSGARRRILSGSGCKGSRTGGLGSRASVMGRSWIRHEFGGAGVAWQAWSDNSELGRRGEAQGRIWPPPLWRALTQLTVGKRLRFDSYPSTRPGIPKRTNPPAFPVIAGHGRNSDGGQIP